MVKNKKVLAVVPARGGSKGIPLKNIAMFHSRPLIEWTASFIQGLNFVDRSVVSTDHPEIARVSERAGLPSPFIRPVDLSGDSVSDADVLIHALFKMEEIDDCIYDVILMLQPTSPFRKATEVRRMIDKLVEEGLDSVVTVSETPLSFHPLKQLVVLDGHLEFFDERGKGVVARQQLTPVYHRNGVAYAMTRSCLVDQNAVIGANGTAHIVRYNVVNIDSYQDLNDGERLPRPDTLE